MNTYEQDVKEMQLKIVYEYSKDLNENRFFVKDLKTDTAVSHKYTSHLMADAALKKIVRERKQTERDKLKLKPFPVRMLEIKHPCFLQECTIRSFLRTAMPLSLKDLAEKLPGIKPSRLYRIFAYGSEMRVSEYVIVSDAIDISKIAKNKMLTMNK